MPEGDTVFKIAAYLHERLAGRRVEGGRVPLQPAIRLAGRRVQGVRAQGKHLWIAFDDGTLLRSHLGLHGSWHRYPIGRPWRKGLHLVSILLETAEESYVCFEAAEVEWVRAEGARTRRLEARLGPDLIGEAVDFSRIVERARRFLGPERLIVDLLLDQRAAAGIGNVYKSEVLFLERLDPHRALGTVEDAALRRLYERAADLLRRNLGPGPRVTRPASEHVRAADTDLWVYGRRGRPCRRCGADIRRERLGLRPRSTYFCPRCQAG